MQDAEKQFAKTRSKADKLKLETAQTDYDNMVRNLKSVTKAAGDTEKAISKIEDTATGSSNAFSGIVGAIAQTGISGCVLFEELTAPVRASQNNAKPLKTLGLDEFPTHVSLPITMCF